MTSLDQEFERGSQARTARSNRPRPQTDEIQKLYNILVQNEHLFREHKIEIFHRPLFGWSSRRSIILSKKRDFWSGEARCIVVDHSLRGFTYGTPTYKYSPSTTGYYSTGFEQTGEIAYELGVSTEDAASKLAYEAAADTLNWARGTDFFDPTVSDGSMPRIPEHGLTVGLLFLYVVAALALFGVIALFRYFK